MDQIKRDFDILGKRLLQKDVPIDTLYNMYVLLANLIAKVDSDAPTEHLRSITKEVVDRIHGGGKDELSDLESESDKEEEVSTFTAISSLINEARSLE